MIQCRRLAVLIVLCLVERALSADPVAMPLRGEIRDADTGELLPARLYIQSADGAKWFFAKSADAKGSAIVYDKARDAKSIEKHTTLSAHPFVAELPPGKYTLTVERGKEYLTATKEVEVGTQPLDVKIKLHRWINMSKLGWNSGDTHVHRPISELKNVALAEDLNVVYPMSQWVTVTHTLPEKGRVDPQPIPTAPIFADPTHAIVPFNTEYEIFSVGTKRHTLGAVLILGQKEPLKIGIPPLKAVAEEAHRQGALLDLEKHSWAWTPIIAPVMKADLYPLSNNHLWRTEFAFKQWTIENNWRDNPRIETDKDGFTELGWLHFGWEQYYAMLNCGLRMRPTAGTANGVHPVPAGFSRVYVHTDDDQEHSSRNRLAPDVWQRRLNEGRSFVTTGPMLTFYASERAGVLTLSGTVYSSRLIHRLEIVRDGEVIETSESVTAPYLGVGSITEFTNVIAKGAESSWVALRCFETLPNGRIRFAHSAPVFLDVPGKPIRPRRDQVRYLVQRCEEEIARNKDVLSDAELAEYREALEFYRGKLETAR